MMISKSFGKTVAGVFAGLAVSVLLCGADDALQNVDARGLAFEAPASWKSKAPKSSMRAAELKVDPIAGDDFPAEMVVYVFPGGVGGVQANIDRWKTQFKDKDGNPPKFENKKVKGKNVDVTRVETSGHYHPSQFPGLAAEPDRDDARFFGAIVMTDKTSYVIKMIGPDKTMNKIRTEFDALLTSIAVEDK
jgi:hypothetical protein